MSTGMGCVRVNVNNGTSSFNNWGYNGNLVVSAAAGTDTTYQPGKVYMGKFIFFKLSVKKESIYYYFLLITIIE
jgi:hypothetical protein